MMADLQQLSRAALPSTFHKSLKCLDLLGRLLRVYTQNIDGLEAKAGLEELDLFDSSLVGRSQGKVALLHGSLKTAVCSAKPRIHKAPLEEHVEEMRGGNLPTCMTCKGEERDPRLRPRAAGQLRPDVTLYNDPTSGDRDACLGSVISGDKGLVGCLVVVGTSLRVHGLKTLVKTLSNRLSARNTIFVNPDPPPSDMKPYFEHHLPITANQFAELILEQLCTATV